MQIGPIAPFSNKLVCPSCGVTITWGVTTTLDKKTNSHICNNCKAVLSKEKD